MHLETKSPSARRSFKFTSQAELFAWIERSRSTTLGRVQVMTLQLTDIDLSSLIKTRTNFSPRHASPTLFDLYERELQRFAHALDSLPNLVEMTVLPPDRMLSRLLQSMYESILTIISQRCNSLRRLRIGDVEMIKPRPSSLREQSTGTKVAREVDARERRDSGTFASMTEEITSPSVQVERPRKRMASQV